MTLKDKVVVLLGIRKDIYKQKLEAEGARVVGPTSIVVVAKDGEQLKSLSLGQFKAKHMTCKEGLERDLETGRCVKKEKEVKKEKKEKKAKKASSGSSGSKKKEEKKAEGPVKKAFVYEAPIRFSEAAKKSQLAKAQREVAKLVKAEGERLCTAVCEDVEGVKKMAVSFKKEGCKLVVKVTAKAKGLDEAKLEKALKKELANGWGAAVEKLFATEDGMVMEFLNAKLALVESK